MQQARFHPLDHLGALTLQGPDALAFLQGQVTADLRLLEPGQGVTAAWCSPQGRVIALLRVARQPDGLLCVLPRELAADIAMRLGRFVLRSRVSIRDLSGEVAVGGLSGAGAGTDPRAPTGDIVALPLPAERELLVAPARLLRDAVSALPTAPPEAWEATCIGLGEPEVYAATSEAWVPQMLNLDLLGAVSFRKGCYPGQEIVARTQNLGRIKRRLFRYRVSGTALPAAGEALWLGGSKVGEVVRSVRHGDVAGLLAVVNLDAAGLGLAAADGAVTCSPEPLPYAVPEAAEAP